LVFTNDKFYDCLESKKLTSLFNALLKFHGNVKHVDKYLFNALLRSMNHVNRTYKALEQEPSPFQSYPELSKAIRLNDRKLVALLKIEEKSRAGLFEKIDPFRFVAYLKLITKIAIRRRFVLV
jgi:hypothetical protein